MRAGHRRRGHPDMAVAEGVDHIRAWRATGRAPAASRASTGGGPSTPRCAPRDAARRARAASCGPARAGCGRAANRAAPRARPARRCRQSAARYPSASRRTCRRRRRSGCAASTSGIADHQVIAALGFERHLVAERGGERLRIGAGADHRGIGRQVAGIGADRGQPAAVEAEAERARPARSRRPCARKCSTRRVDQAERVAGMAVLAHQQAADIVARQRRFELAQFVGVELVDLDPVLAPQRPGEPVLRQRLRRSGRRRDGRADGRGPRRRRRFDQLRTSGSGRRRPAAAGPGPGRAPSPASPARTKRTQIRQDRRQIAPAQRQAARAGPSASAARC